MTSPAKPPIFPDNIQFWYEAKRAFGASRYGASEFGEVLAATNRITSGNGDSWYSEWNASANRVLARNPATENKRRPDGVDVISSCGKGAVINPNLCSRESEFVFSWP